MGELLACPVCKDVPEIGYACGEFFIFSPVKSVGECFCGNFVEMHSSEKVEEDAWNRAVEAFRAKNENICNDCLYENDDGGYCLECYYGNKKEVK